MNQLLTILTDNYSWTGRGRGLVALVALRVVVGYE